jgi:alpha-glucoside transport system permease protein
MASTTTHAPRATNTGLLSYLAAIRPSPKWIVHFILITMMIVWLVPSVGLLITSFRPPSAIADSGWWTALWPARFTVQNYELVLFAQGMGDAFRNSFLITVPSTIFPLIVASLAAYAFAWIPFPGRDTIFLIVLVLLIIPIQTTLVPVLQLFNSLGLTGTLVGIWIAHTAYGLPFAIFLLRNFFAALPRDLFESAKIDGANEITVFFRIVLPLSVPALASLLIFQFMWVWNDLLISLVFMSNPEYQPMTVRIQAMLGTYATEWHIMSSAAFISMLVPLIVFFALQRYFVTGLTAGAVKS